MLGGWEFVWVWGFARSCGGRLACWILLGWALSADGLVAAGLPTGAVAPIAAITPGENFLSIHNSLYERSGAAKEHSTGGYKDWLRRKVYSQQDDARYGLRLDDPQLLVRGRQLLVPGRQVDKKRWADSENMTGKERPLVVLLHGYNSCLEKNKAILEPIRHAGFPCAGFSYPNDYYLAASAERLSLSLKQFARQYPKRKVVLLTHSMGGLVARACLEDPGLDPGNVMRLIMIAPPSQGTLVANVAVATDVWEHWLGRKSGGPWARLRDSVVDGLGEAADDLVPGSPFLQRLNARPRNTAVEYTILLGTGASISQAEMDWVRSAIHKTAGALPGIRRASDKLDETLAEMEEMVEGKGDGIVAVKRGLLAGVDDVILLSFGHLSVTAQPASDPVRQVHKEIMARLMD